MHFLATFFRSNMMATIWGIFNLLLMLAIALGIGYLLALLSRALEKHLNAKPVRNNKAAVCCSLGEALKKHRVERKMTQEFVAEHLGVSRQAVSKWENGTSDPSTANLLALAKLYGISAADLLRDVEN